MGSRDATDGDFSTDPYAALVARDRVATSRAQVRRLHEDVAEWIGHRNAGGIHQGPYRRHARHFHRLHHALSSALDGIDARLQALSLSAPAPGARHATCRAYDRSVSQLRDLFTWYAGRCGQREDPRVQAVVAAADEVARSCWDGALARLPHRGSLLAPLVYVDEWPVAAATLRGGVPDAVRYRLPAGLQSLETLPLPVIAVPTATVTEPWWLATVGHEVGHHLERELGLRVADALPAAVRDSCSATLGGPMLAATIARWRDWAGEAFADAVAVGAMGPAATWALAEVEYADPRSLLLDPAGHGCDRYPPPVVRLALSGELEAAYGFTTAGRPGAAGATAWFEKQAHALAPEVADRLRRQLLLTPYVARALLDLDVEGQPLARLCGPADVTTWRSWHDRYARDLLTPRARPPKLQRREAARQLVAAAVTAWQQVQNDPPRSTALRTALLEQLAVCGPPGTLAAGAGTSPAELDALGAALLEAVLPPSEPTNPPAGSPLSTRDAARAPAEIRLAVPEGLHA